MKMDDISLLELWELSDVIACISNVHFEKVLPMETIGHPNAETFPQELPQKFPTMGQGYNGNLVCLLVANKHLSFDAIFLQSLHEASARNGSASYSLRCVD